MSDRIERMRQLSELQYNSVFIKNMMAIGTTERRASCHACLMLKNGVKSRRRPRHTCGKK